MNGEQSRSLILVGKERNLFALFDFSPFSAFKCCPKQDSKLSVSPTSVFDSPALSPKHSNVWRQFPKIGGKMKET